MHSSRERPIFDLRAFAEPFGERERVRDPRTWSGSNPPSTADSRLGLGGWNPSREEALA